MIEQPLFEWLLAAGIAIVVFGFILLSVIVWWINFIRDEKTKKRKFSNEEKMIKPEKLAEFKKKGTTAAENMMQMAGLVRDVTIEFMKIQYSRMLGVALLIAPVFAIGSWPEKLIIAGMFLLGTVISIGLGIFGMFLGCSMNWRVAIACTKGRNAAFKVGIIGGAIGGYVAIGVAYITILLVAQYVGISEAILTALSIGASLNAMFARAGAGVYTKSADNGADIAGKSGLGLEEDDPRNAAVIADNSGDILNELGASFADGHDTIWQQLVAILVLLVLAAFLNLVAMPFIIMAIGMIACMIGTLVTLLIRVVEDEEKSPTNSVAKFFFNLRKDPSNLITAGNVTTYLLFIGGIAILTQYGLHWRYALAVIGCMLASALVGFFGIDVYTSDSKLPTIRIARLSRTNASLTINAGIRNGFLSAAVSTLIIGIAVYFAAMISAPVCDKGNIIGICMGGMGVVSIMAQIFTIDGNGPLSDNAKSFAEQAGLKDEYNRIADENDSRGNRDKAICKGNILVITGIASAAMLMTFNELAQKIAQQLGLTFNPSSGNPIFVAGAFIGAAAVYFFLGMTIDAALSTTQKMVDFVIKDFKQIAAGYKETAAYRECVRMAITASLKALFKPALTLIGIIFAAGTFLGIEALAGFVFSVVITCIPLGIWLSSAGGSWDNAKKIIESGILGPWYQKHTFAHRNGIVGDMVGDIFKDIIGPLCNAIIAVTLFTVMVFLINIYPGVQMIIIAIIAQPWYLQAGLGAGATSITVITGIIVKKYRKNHPINDETEMPDLGEENISQ